MQYLASVNSAAQLAAILDATPTAVIVVDADGTIVSCQIGCFASERVVVTV